MFSREADKHFDKAMKRADRLLWALPFIFLAPPLTALLLHFYW